MKYTHIPRFLPLAQQELEHPKPQYVCQPLLKGQRVLWQHAVFMDDQAITLPLDPGIDALTTALYGLKNIFKRLDGWIKPLLYGDLCTFYVFDYVRQWEQGVVLEDQECSKRVTYLNKTLKDFHSNIIAIPFTLCYDRRQIEEYFGLCQDAGHEGIILRDPQSPYYVNEYSTWTWRTLCQLR